MYENYIHLNNIKSEYFHTEKNIPRTLSIYSFFLYTSFPIFLQTNFLYAYKIYVTISILSWLCKLVKRVDFLYIAENFKFSFFMFLICIYTKYAHSTHRVYSFLEYIWYIARQDSFNIPMELNQDDLFLWKYYPLYVCKYNIGKGNNPHISITRS